MKILRSPANTCFEIIEAPAQGEELEQSQRMLLLIARISGALFDDDPGDVRDASEKL
jgi:hypothetical protein